MTWGRDCNWTDGEPTGSWKMIKQGSVDNCALLAAISSHRWTTQTISVTRVNTACPPNTTPRVYQVRLYYYPDDAGCTGIIDGRKESIFIYINDYLLRANNDFLWAKVDSSSTCMWPGLIEKAYADLCEFLYHHEQAHTNPANPVDQPSWETTPPPWDGGFHPLSHLQLCSEKNCLSPTLTEIKKICGTSGKTKFPTIANSKDPQPTGSEITKNHTYSVLGLYPATSTATHIVIRNPKREGKSTKYSLSNNNSPPTIWTSQGGMSLNTGYNVPNNLGDGIMTVYKDDFSSCFYDINYVKL